MSKVKLFISHSSKDEELAKRLLDAIEDSLQVPLDSIRCTSVPGYKLELGALPAQKLKEELEQAQLVLAILSPNSRKADWVLFELGAAWGLVRKTIPLLAGGLKYKDLPGPLQTTNSVMLSDITGVTHLIADVSKMLNWPIGNLSKGQNAQKELADYAQNLSQYAFPSERIIRREELPNPEQKLRWIDIEEYCREELYIWGWSCRNVIGPKSRNVFKIMIAKGVKIKFLIQDPNAVSNAKELDFGPVCDWTHEDIAIDIAKGIETIREFFEQMPIESRANLELKTTKWVMTWSGIAIDPETERGLLQIELYHYRNPERLGNHLDSRPELIIKQDSTFYKGFCNSLIALWNNANPVQLF